MDYDALRRRFADVGFTTPVPFTAELDVDHGALRTNLEALVEAGARLFIPCGNTSEHDALTPAERTAVVETHVAALPDDATVVGGVSGSTRSAIAAAEAYADVGADGVMVMHPSFTYAHERGLVNHYRRIADATDLGVVVYRRGPAVSRRVLVDIVERENVVAVKFAEDDLVEFGRVTGDAPDAVTWVTGNAERFAIAFAQEGAAGFTTGLGNVVPEAPLALQDAIQADDWERAREIRDRVRPFEDLRAEPGEGNEIAAANNVPAVKHGMDYVGLTGGPVRDPLVPLSTAAERRVESIVDDLRTIDR